MTLLKSYVNLSLGTKPVGGFMSKRNVAIYARVSTEHEAQLSALDNQVQYYDNILAMHPDWVLYNRYIDEGITGTSTKKRKQFMQMMEDAKTGCFDLIVTREVSRFARNTVDTLQETRKLRRIGVEVYFTEDNIWTLNDEDGELRLTIMATLAQNESKKTSLRVKAGQKVSFQNGVMYGNGNILGYDRVGKELIINSEQAETVRMIYNLYQEGMGARSIQYELEKRGRLTAMGLKNWSPANITRILKNPFYCGIIVYRKQYVPDYLEQKKINNFGAVDKITVEGSHEPIISKEQFAAVQKIIDSKTTTTSNRRKIGTKPFECVWSGKMKCECGGSFNRKIWHTKKDGIKQFAFQCNKQIRTGTVKTRQKKGLSIEGVCTSPMIQDWKLELMAKVILDTLWKDKSEVLRIANELLDECIKESGGISSREKEIQRYENLISNQQNKLEKLLDMCLNEIITKEDYVKKRSVLEDEIRTNQAMIDTLNADAEDSESKAEKKIKALKDKLNNSLNFNTYHIPDGIIASLVDEIRVYKDRFEWKLKIFNDKATIVTGVDADKNASIITDDFPSYWDSSTGCNC